MFFFFYISLFPVHTWLFRDTDRLIIEESSLSQTSCIHLIQHRTAYVSIIYNTWQMCSTVFYILVYDANVYFLLKCYCQRNTRVGKRVHKIHSAINRINWKIKIMHIIDRPAGAYILCANYLSKLDHWWKCTFLLLQPTLHLWTLKEVKSSITFKY